MPDPRPPVPRPPVPRPPVPLAELLAAATARTVLPDAPGKSGATLERLVIGDQPYVLKHLDLAEDWTMRASGCLRGAPLVLWERGILSRLPKCFNQPIVAAAPLRPTSLAASPLGPSPLGPSPLGPSPLGGCTLLMRDVTPWLVPATDAPITLDQHARFLRHMAALHAQFWDCGAEFDVVPVMHRYLELSPWTADAEASIGSAHLVPQLVAKGWPLLAQVAPAAAAVVTRLAYDPGPLVQALAATPQTFVHSNWKLDNLGTDDTGRTVLLDWEQPGCGAPLSDLAWYLAINCRRLPQAKEASIASYREALESCGIDTGPWWERQLALCLLGALVQFGWEKAFGGYDEELGWWERHAVAAAALLS
ncbi:MAG: phosphotransferase [Actinomycetota bacterium]|nr:phosphotransferase [Actinomycetota bacterium]